MNAEHEQSSAGVAACAFATKSMWRLVWDSVRDSCIRPDRPIREGRTRECSCKSPATMRSNLPVPGQKYTFGVVKAAQARGDFQVLAERGRRALRVHLGNRPKDAVWRRCSSGAESSLVRSIAELRGDTPEQTATRRHQAQEPTRSVARGARACN